MEYSIQKEKNWQTTVSVTVSAEDVQAQYDNALNKVKKDVKLEGFRKGKVPAPMVKKLYGPLIDTEAEDLCVQQAWRTVFEENKFYPINDPQLTSLDRTESGGMTFNIVFDIYPEFTVEGFDDMPVERTTFVVEQKDVDRVVEDLRQRNAMLYSIDGEAKAGDYIYADLQEVDSSGVPVIGQKIENQQIWLNSDDTELTPQLLGVKAGEQRVITLRTQSQKSEIIEQPDHQEVIEKKYKVDVKEVKERRLPELDDEFAKDMGPFESLQQMLDKIESDLKHEAEHESEHAFEHALSEALLERVDLEVPESMLSRYLDDLVKDMVERNKENPQGLSPEDYRRYLRDGAIRDLKWHLVSEQLKKQENFTVTDEDVEKKLAHYAEHGEDGIKHAEQIRNDQAALAKLKEGIITDKLYAFLAEKATITDVQKTWSELVEPQPEEAAADVA